MSAAFAAASMIIWFAGSPARAECSCATLPPDPCVQGNWVMDARELSQVTDNLLKLVPGKIEWRDGQVLTLLESNGTYRNRLHGIETAMVPLIGSELEILVSGGTSGEYCASSGKICFTETGNTLKMKMQLPATQRKMDIPISKSAKAEAVDLDYSCTGDDLHMRMITPDSQDELSFRMSRQ